MTEKFLVAVDASPGSERALKAAITVAKSSGTELVLVHIIEWSPFSFHTPDELAERHKRREEELDRAKEALLSPAEAAASAAGVAFESIVRHGNPAEMLADIAEETGVIQMYVGRTGGAQTQRLLFGSVASSLIQISTVPVTVVP